MFSRWSSSSPSLSGGRRESSASGLPRRSRHARRRMTSDLARRVGLFAALAVLISVPFIVHSAYWLRIANNVAIMFALTLGLEFIWGRAGQLSFAQAGFFVIGAYTSSLLALDLRLPVVVTIPLAGMAAVVGAIVIGWPTLRLKTHYFALATFGFSEIVRLVAMNWKTVTRGMDGVTQIPPVG